MRTVFVVTKNTDFTEGRGPMLFHSAWETKGLAVAYVMAQGGIFGSKQGLRSASKDGKYWTYNGYEIAEIDVRDNYDPAAIQSAQQRLDAAKRELAAADAEMARFR